MSDSKISTLPLHVSPASEDLLVIIDDPNGTPDSKKITLKIIFDNIPSNTSIAGILTAAANVVMSGSNTYISSNTTITGTTTLNKTVVSSNGIVITNTLTPANSSASNIETGKIFYSNNYLYVKVSNTVIKRVPLSSF